MLQSAFGQGPLSEVSVAGATASVEVWIGLRALLGLYPGYGLNQAKELRRQTYAVADAPPTCEIPILIGGGGEKVTFRIVTEHAYICNGLGDPERVTRKSRILDDWCCGVGATRRR